MIWGSAMIRRGLVALMVLAGTAAWAQDVPIVRYTTWMIVPPETVVEIESRPYGMRHDDYTYLDQPSWSVLDLDGEVTQRMDGKLGRTSTLTVTDEGPRLLRLHPGRNYAVPRPDADSYWYIATPEAPLNVVGGFDALYFYLPPGLTAGTVLCHAFSPGEAGKLVVSDLDGDVLGSYESDFNEPEAMVFRLDGPNPDGMALKLALVEPEHPDWSVDDAAVWLGLEMPGLLAPTPQAAILGGQSAYELGIDTDWRPLRDFEGDESPIMTIQWSKLVEEGATLPAYDVALSDERSFGGEQSLRVQMRFPEDYAERWQELKLFTEPLEVDGLRKVRFFLYGDGSGRALRVRVRDSSREHHYFNAGTIDWTGWKTVVADFENATMSIAGGDENRRIDGPTVNVVLQISHSGEMPLESVLYVDDLAVQE